MTRRTREHRSIKEDIRRIRAKKGFGQSIAPTRKQRAARARFAAAARRGKIRKGSKL